MALPAWTGWQFAPAAALLGLVLAYPLWSWRRLSAAAQFLRTEMQHLQREGMLVLKAPAGEPVDFLERRINAVESASRQLRDLHHFVSTSLQQLPSPNFVCDAQGRILLVNVAAQRHAGYSGHVGHNPLQPPVHLQGKPITQVLRDLLDPQTQQPLITTDKLLAGQMPLQSEGRDAQDRSLLVLCKPFTEFANVGWLITLVDMTDMHRALQQRDQALHFISHDIRAPNASILTLLEMERAYPGRMPADTLMQRIERYAQTSLGMAESFVRLASAQTQDYHMAELDLVDLLQETADDAWALAQQRHVQIALQSLPDTAPCHGDRTMLRRALANVLNNAIKYSPDNGVVKCSIRERSAHWVISVRDEGPGIAPDQQKRLFTPFTRLHDQSHPHITGTGLGLALVHAVVQRHGGHLEVQSEAGQGAEFCLLLPREEQRGD
jgi:signal transduction histidine kinase